MDEEGASKTFCPRVYLAIKGNGFAPKICVFLRPFREGFNGIQKDSRGEEEAEDTLLKLKRRTLSST